jgi:uncharacterized protein with HEPN domain
MNRHIALLNHILEAIASIEEYTLTISEEKFLSSRLIQDAVLRNLEIIGEASRNISPEIKDQYPQVPWRKINGMRNKLIHEYTTVDIKTVWNVLQVELPELKKHALQILNSK